MTLLVLLPAAYCAIAGGVWSELRSPAHSLPQLVVLAWCAALWPLLLACWLIDPGALPRVRPEVSDEVARRRRAGALRV